MNADRWSVALATRVNRARTRAASYDLILRRVRFQLDRPADGGFFLLSCRLAGLRCDHLGGHLGWHEELLRNGGRGVSISTIETTLQSIARELNRP